MRLFARNQGKKTRGQTMVEFALILPLLLTTMYGVMELGRLLFIYVTTTSAAREATRFATAVEVNESSSVERYRDCDGIRAAASRLDVLSAIQTIDINYYHDYGGVEQYRGSCPAGGVGPNLDLGDQVVVEVNSRFDLIVPIVPIDIDTITSESARTVIKDVPIGLLVPAISPGTPAAVPPPWTYFGGTYGFKPENDANPHYYIPLKVTMPDGSDYAGTVPVTYRVSGEATVGNDYLIHSPNPIDVTGGSGSIHVEVLDDTFFEYYERVILYLEDAPPGGIIWPSTYVLYIVDDDRIPPVVEFETASSLDIVEGTLNFPINLIMDKVSQRDTYVPITVITGLNPEDATLGWDFLPEDWDFTSQSTVVRIPANTYPTYPFNVDIFDDSVLEETENVVFMLGTPLNATLGAQITHTLTIADNDSVSFDCANYEAERLYYLGGNQMGVSLSNNDPNLSPVYIREITARWRGNNSQIWYLQRIDFGGTRIWDTVTTSPFNYSWPSVNIDRQLPAGSKNLIFTTSRNNVIMEEITVTLDNGCVVSQY